MKSSRQNVIIETDRLYLTEFTTEIASNFFELNQDKDVLKYTGDKPFDNLIDCQKFLSNYDHYKEYGYGRWSLYNKANNSWIGWCGLKNQSPLVADIGFRIYKKEWGQGYATEGAQACIQYGFEKLKLQKIIARSSSNNIASKKVIKKLSLQYVKTMDIEGIPLAEIYEITKEQYNNQKNAG